MNRIQFMGNSFFIPFFLLSTGMLIDPWLLFTDRYTIKVSFIMIFIAIISKWFAAHLFGLYQKYSKTERGIVYGMSVNQAAATLAAVMVGYRVGIFNEAILTGTIMMILATCFTGSMVTEKYSRQLILTASEALDFSNVNLPDRILVPISHPKSVNRMMDLAILLQPEKSEEPLYPLHIALEGGNLQKQIVEGENILTKATIRANTTKRRTIPLIKIDYNISSGILEAIKEHRISKIIMGWNEPTNFKHTFFDSIMEQLVKSSNEMILISRLVQPINITRRVLLIIPPFINKQYGFIDTLRSLNRLSMAISAKLEVISEETTYNEIKHIFAKDNVSHDFINITSWKKIYNDMKKIVDPKDTIIQIIAREGRIAWRLSFDQMPYRLKQSFPDNNLLVVYPYFHLNDTYNVENLFTEDLYLLNSIPEENFIFNTMERDPEILFEKVSRFPYFDRPESIKAQLSSVLKDYPIELTPDVLLIHVHTNEISSNQIFPAINKVGFEVENVESRPKIIIVLIVPEDQPVQQHLNTLSQISRMVMVKDLIDNLLVAEDYDEFTRLIRQEIKKQG